MPLALLPLALGTAQGPGFLVAQWYEPPVRRISLAVGAASLLNAALGAHQAQVSRAGTAIVAGPGAGAHEGRWRASALAGASMLGLALAAGSAFAVASAVPASLVAVVVGLAVLPVLRTAARGSLSGPLRLGGGTALVVAALPVGALGTTAAVWAIPAGLAVLLPRRAARALDGRPARARPALGRLAQRRVQAARLAEASQRPPSPVGEREAGAGDEVTRGRGHEHLACLRLRRHRRRCR